jgi:hypothetical protein
VDDHSLASQWPRYETRRSERDFNKPTKILGARHAPRRATGSSRKGIRAALSFLHSHWPEYIHSDIDI